MKLTFAAVAAIGLGASLAAQGAGERPRARDIGIAPGTLATGPLNAITDVEGVRVGQVTLVEGDNVRTGVTVVLPHPGNLFQDKVPGGVFVGNAFGKLAGSTQVEELGTIEAPIVLTNTLSVAAGIEGAARWVLDYPGNEEARSVNVVVGETNDGELNDIRGMHVRPRHVVEAITAAATGPVAEGSVGAGTGTVAFGWKGGIGTSSRRVPRGSEPGEWTVGVLVQTNYGGALRIDGRLIPPPPRAAGEPEPTPDGSCIIVVATDAPLDARDLKRLAARAVFAMARTGSTFSNGSGDYAIAFSTHSSLRVRMREVAPQLRTVLPTDGVSPLFTAALDATEEAIYNSILKATTVTGKGRTTEALPIDRVMAMPEPTPTSDTAPAGCGDLRRLGPQTFDEAVAALSRCVSDADRASARAEAERDYVGRHHMGKASAVRNAWLMGPKPPLWSALLDLGFQYPEDMSSALMSAVWHRLQGLPFNLQARIACAAAWNAESERLRRSRPGSQQVLLPAFDCSDTSAIEAGRPHWPKR